MLHRSPALTAIYNEVKSSDRNHILDLGPMSKGCFDLFSGLSCRIKIEDIASYVAVQLGEQNGREQIDFASYMQVYGEDEKFDVILAWDILNYLELNQIQQLFELLKPHCKADTLIYMLRYVRKHIPNVPRFFEVKDQYTIEMTEGQLAPREVQSPSTLQLLSCMPGSFMQETMVEKTGMQADITEHVIRYLPSADKKHLVSRSEEDKVESVDLGARCERLHTSPSIEMINKLMQEHRDMVVLDLGSQAGRNKDRLVNLAGKYYNADIYQTIQNAQANNKDELNLSVLDFECSLKFDIILVWDIFNYCTPKQLSQLEKALALYSHKNTSVLSYVYTGKTLPTKPNQFQVVDNSHVKIISNAKDKNKKSAFTGVTLLKSMVNFDLNKSFAYRAGMDREIIEYFFVAREQSQIISFPLEQREVVEK
ncbi:hypothetical protein TDB9533_04188 [Thalassocella blandensis]|nr:hypothetical protein TDB9533_04188 [Thalassocella blandensis]